MVLVLVPSMRILSKIESMPMLGSSLNLYRAINFSSLNVKKFKNPPNSILWKIQKLKKTSVLQLFKSLKNSKEPAKGLMIFWPII
jgi:hypothetical protein